MCFAHMFGSFLLDFARSSEIKDRRSESLSLLLSFPYSEVNMGPYTGSSSIISRKSITCICSELAFVSAKCYTGL